METLRPHISESSVLGLTEVGILDQYALVLDAGNTMEIWDITKQTLVNRIPQITAFLPVEAYHLLITYAEEKHEFLFWESSSFGDANISSIAMLDSGDFDVWPCHVCIEDSVAHLVTSRQIMDVDLDSVRSGNIHVETRRFPLEEIAKEYISMLEGEGLFKEAVDELNNADSRIANILLYADFNWRNHTAAIAMAFGYFVLWNFGSNKYRFFELPLSAEEKAREEIHLRNVSFFTNKAFVIQKWNNDSKSDKIFLWSKDNEKVQRGTLNTICGFEPVSFHKQQDRYLDFSGSGHLAVWDTAEEKIIFRCDHYDEDADFFVDNSGKALITVAHDGLTEHDLLNNIIYHVSAAFRILRDAEPRISGTYSERYWIFNDAYNHVSVYDKHRHEIVLSLRRFVPERAEVIRDNYYLLASDDQMRIYNLLTGKLEYSEEFDPDPINIKSSFPEWDGAWVMAIRNNRVQQSRYDDFPVIKTYSIPLDERCYYLHTENTIIRIEKRAFSQKYDDRNFSAEVYPLSGGEKDAYTIGDLTYVRYSSRSCDRIAYGTGADRLSVYDLKSREKIYETDRVEYTIETREGDHLLLKHKGSDKADVYSVCKNRVEGCINEDDISGSDIVFFADRYLAAAFYPENGQILIKIYDMNPSASLRGILTVREPNGMLLHSPEIKTSPSEKYLVLDTGRFYRLYPLREENDFLPESGVYIDVVCDDLSFSHEDKELILWGKDGEISVVEPEGIADECVLNIINKVNIAKGEK